jgi:hypothetical protein
LCLIEKTTNDIGGFFFTRRFDIEMDMMVSWYLTVSFVSSRSQPLTGDFSMCGTDSNDFDPAEQTPGMTINVSLGEFHSTHDVACAAKQAVTGDKDFSGMSVDQLQAFLAQLEAGQRLTDAEDDIDAWCATSYFDEIGKVKGELKRRVV